MWQVYAAASSESNLKTYLYKTFNRLVHECLNSCQQFKMILPGGISRTLSVLFLTANTLSQAQLDHLDAHEKQTENITNSSPTKTRKSHDHHFDFLMFTQLWPISNCIDWEERGSGHTCSLNGKSSLSLMIKFLDILLCSFPEWFFWMLICEQFYISDDFEWTVHGIWPTTKHKKGPLFCR